MIHPYRHLDGAVFDSLSRPHLLITDAYNALSVQARRKERDKALLGECWVGFRVETGIGNCLSILDKIVNTLRKNGNVLICVDTAGRVLELSQLLVCILTYCVVNCYVLEYPFF